MEKYAVFVNSALVNAQHSGVNKAAALICFTLLSARGCRRYASASMYTINILLRILK